MKIILRQETTLPKIKKTESQITNRSYYLEKDGKRYRFLLEKEWSITKTTTLNKSATVILLNPHKANELITDKTVMNVTNFVILEDYNSLKIVNLFPFMSKKPEALVTNSKEFIELNKQYIKKACENSEIIILACGAKGKYLPLKNQIYNEILVEFKDKLRCFQDKEKNENRHPRDMTDEWKLVKYKQNGIE
ncbi:DUF1643 domain-containing protein [Bacillus sp. FSL K6-1012]|uniref:DUF1643 domain-containing protein n=1 Tax=Bacillus TaxID=1386 RepID=UPI0030D0D9B8